MLIYIDSSLCDRALLDVIGPSRVGLRIATDPSKVEVIRKSWARTVR